VLESIVVEGIAGQGRVAGKRLVAGIEPEGGIVQGAGRRPEGRLRHHRTQKWQGVGSLKGVGI
jgi:hypothetical protein